MTIQELQAKYAPISNAKGYWPSSSPKKTKPKPKRPAKPGSFTEVERAILLRSVIDTLRARGVEFSVWHKYGLSRIYFEDDSWLSYGADGVSIYGPDKKGAAYLYRTELGLSKAAKKGALL